MAGLGCAGRGERAIPTVEATADGDGGVRGTLGAVLRLGRQRAIHQPPGHRGSGEGNLSSPRLSLLLFRLCELVPGGGGKRRSRVKPCRATRARSPHEGGEQKAFEYRQAPQP